MSEHRKKITIRVSSQTAYHLEAEGRTMLEHDTKREGESSP